MPYGERYRPDRLFLPQQMLLSADLPTPYYLYDEDGIRKTARTILGSFRLNAGHTPYFPLKANCTPAVLRALVDEGFGILALSEPELRFAHALGFSGERLLFHTPAMTERAAVLCLETGAGVIFDSPCQIERFGAHLPERCLLRYHPGKTKNSVHYSGNTDRNKSGMSREQVFDAAKLLSARGVHFGLHCHLGAGSRMEAFYPNAAAELFGLARELYAETGIRAEFCDIGGGLGVSDTPGEPDLNLPRIGALVRGQYEQYFSDEFAPQLFTELGRFVTARHGILISRVAEVRERTRRYAVLDASAAYVPHILLHHAEHHISVVGKSAKHGRMVYSVHGCTADAQDRFHDRAMLHELHAGDLAAIHNVGAYAESMQLCHSMLPPCRSFIYTLDGRIISAE